MSRLLVPVDHSPQSFQAVRFAIALSGGTQKLTLLHVIPPFPSRRVVHHVGEKTVQQFQLDEAKESLREILQLVQEANVPFELHYEFGDPHEVIASYAKQGHHAVVMGTHGYGRITGYLLNSVSYPALYEVNIPVFLVPEEAEIRTNWQKVLVAVDGSEHSKQAANWAIQFAREKEVRFLLLTVVTPPVMYGPDGTGWIDMEALKSLGEEILQPYEEMFILQQIPFESKVVIGNPAAVIKETAQETKADLIALGHHGLSGLVESLMGSVTYKVIHRTKTPLLIVKN